MGLQAGVSGGIGATNACTRMYRPAFITEQGLRSYKACRASSSICPWMDRSGVPDSRAPKVGALGDAGAVAEEAVRPHNRAALSFAYFFWHKRNWLSRLLDNNYEVVKALVCETLFR